MAHLQTSFVEFRETLQQQIREIERNYPERYSKTWFFLRYLKRLQKRALEHHSPRACNSIMRGLTRYYVDSVDDDSPLVERFDIILEAHRYALRTERRGEDNF